MATIPVSVEENLGAGEDGGKGQFIRVIVADTQAIFRAGLRKVFALEDDIRVVGQAETLAQTQSAVAKFTADVLIFEAALTPNPVEAVAELLRQNPQLRIVVVTPGADEELTLELFRRGAHGIVSREVEPELLVECLRKVVAGETWLDSQGMRWVMEAYRNQNEPARGIAPESAADAERNADRFLRDAGNEEQRDCFARGHDRAGGEELFAQSLRQAGSGRPPGTGAVLPESSRGRQYKSARAAGICSEWHTVDCRGRCCGSVLFWRHCDFRSHSGSTRREKLSCKILPRVNFLRKLRFRRLPP